MSEQNIKKFYETLARIISEREQVKITVSVSKKEAAGKAEERRRWEQKEAVAAV